MGGSYVDDCREGDTMTLTDALDQAQTDHVIYFLLTAYVESLGWYDASRSAFPAQVTRIPVAGMRDVLRRLQSLLNVRASRLQAQPEVRPMWEEAVAVFGAALRRLKALARSAQGTHERVQEISPRESQV